MKATSISVGERSGILLAPIARGRPSLHDSAGLWQLAQEIVLEPDSNGSKNSFSPSVCLAVLKGLLSGKGMVAGRR